MSTQADNKRLMQRFTEEFWNRGNIAFADEIVAENLIHDQLPPDWPQGREGFKRLVQTWRGAFPTFTNTSSSCWPKEIARWAGSG